MLNDMMTPVGSRTPMTVIAFDYGVKRIGMAVGQNLTLTARPLATIPVKQQQPQWSTINALLKEWQPKALVVGLPCHLDGSDNGVTLAIRRFCQELETRYHLPVYTVDERLSSVAALERIQSVKAGNWREQCDPQQAKCYKEIDAVAAQIILETWLAECPSII